MYWKGRRAEYTWYTDRQKEEYMHHKKYNKKKVTDINIYRNTNK